MKTAVLDEFAAYARACNEGHAALWALWGSSTAAWERAELYRGKMSAMDSCWAGVQRRVCAQLRRDGWSGREEERPPVVLG